MGILVPAYDLQTVWRGLWGSGWKPFLPLEEFAFYALGFVAMLLLYVWGDEILFRTNKVDDRQRTPRVFCGWKATLLFWLTVGVVLFGISLGHICVPWFRGEDEHVSVRIANTCLARSPRLIGRW